MTKPQAGEDVMLQTGIAALEHARDLRVKVGVSDLQAAALLRHIAELEKRKPLTPWERGLPGLGPR